MRVHIELDDALVAEIDRLAGSRGRTAFVRRAVEQVVADRQRRESLLSAAGVLSRDPHEWDEDPAAWVRAQRRADVRRIG